MSGKIMGQVYDRECHATERDVLLALGDHSDHWGKRAWASVGRLAWKLTLHPRTVQRTLRRLEGQGVLEPKSRTNRGCTVYTIHLTKLSKKPAYQCDDEEDEIAVKAGKLPPLKTKKVKSVTPGKMPGAAKRQGGARCQGGGGIAVPPKPSMNQKGRGGGRQTTTTAEIDWSEIPEADAERLRVLIRAGIEVSKDLAGWRRVTRGMALDQIAAIAGASAVEWPSQFRHEMRALRDAQAKAKRLDAEQIAHAERQQDTIREHNTIAQSRAREAGFIAARARAAQAHPWWSAMCDTVLGSLPSTEERKAVDLYLRHGAYLAEVIDQPRPLLRIAAQHGGIAATLRGGRFAKPLHIACAAHSGLGSVSIEIIVHPDQS